MSIDNLYNGHIGEKLTQALLLRYLTIAKPVPDTGIDEAGFLRDWLYNEIGEPVTFKVQTKTGKYFSVKRKTFDRWLELFEKESIILIHVKIVTIKHQIFKCKSFHEWLIENPNWSEGEKKGKPIYFKLSDFIELGEEKNEFKDLLINEANRILKKKSIWRLNRNLLYLPLKERDIFENFGKLSRFEISTTISDDLKKSNFGKSNILTDIDLHSTLRSIWKFPKKHEYDIDQLSSLKSWLNSINSKTKKGEIKREMKLFSLFVQSMKDYSKGKLFWIPGFNHLEISSWRVFVQMYPESMNLFKCVLNNPTKWRREEILSSFLLLSAIANEADRTLKGNVIDVMKKVENTYRFQKSDNYQNFRIIRQYSFGLIEATGDCNLINKHIELVTLHDPDWDLQLNREYYQDKTNESLKRSSLRKLTNPKPRDEKTLQITEFMYNRILDRTNTKHNIV